MAPADLSWREDLVAKAQMNAKLCTGQHRCVIEAACMME